MLRCWVCFKPLGPRTGKPKKFTCAVVKAPDGTEHLTHHVCVKDADGKKIGDSTIEEGIRR